MAPGLGQGGREAGAISDSGPEQRRHGPRRLLLAGGAGGRGERAARSSKDSGVKTGMGVSEVQAGCPGGCTK